MLCLKHHVYKTLYLYYHGQEINKTHENLIPQNKQTYLTVQTVTDNTIKHTNIPYNWPAFISSECWNHIFTCISLIGICY